MVTLKFILFLLFMLSIGYLKNVSKCYTDNKCYGSSLPCGFIESILYTILLLQDML
jgi:hypothetical protein